MVIIEVPLNSNCEASEMRAFHDVEAPRPVEKVCLERTPGEPAWFAVTGWTPKGAVCPAVAQRVDDSGEGSAILIRGGEAGLRLKSAGSPEPWSINSIQQWGVPFLLIANDAACVAYSEEVHG